MRRAGICLYAVVLGLCVSLNAHAGVLKAAGEDLEISLVTYGPGAIYWERFGHDAIRIRDRVSGESGDFNYGVFDFQDSAFILNFARGHMRYMIDIGSSDINQQDYIDAGRSILVQRLALSSAQAETLRDFLLWNLRPENLSYDYDYLTSNCSTRVRDALNSVLDGALQSALTARPAPMTYRQQIDRLMSAQSWLMLLMDLGLGPSADRPLNEWQESFVPMVLARELRTVRVPDGHKGFKPLVTEEREISPNRLEPPPTWPPDLRLPLGIAGLTLAAAILFARSRFPVLQASLVLAFLLAAGLLGTLLLALWTLTTHYAAWANANLLVFNPLAFAMIGAVWRSRNGAGGSRFLRALLAIQVGAALVALLIHFLSGRSQQNLPWLLFAVPIWLAISIGPWSALFRRWPLRLPSTRAGARTPPDLPSNRWMHAMAWPRVRGGAILKP
jgi:Domain of unknown function (DUF4105)